ncbi:MAG: bifunctional 2',3'-cyclic-nucleotide 2'-phosphodiesterase/3'-nucleotidase [Filifactoraceae bacterium]
MLGKGKKILSLALCLMMVVSVFSRNSFAASEDAVKVKIMLTTDVHTAFTDYNYYTDSVNEQAGFVKIATLIKNHQKEMEGNTLLFDNGDLIQGSPYGDYIARVKGLKKDEIYPMMEAMNKLGYDAATLGNHEFNYGLEYLENVISKAKFPYLSANIYKVDENTKKMDESKSYIKPYVILDKKFKDETGKEVVVKVGVIGVVAPQITVWDSANLTGKVDTVDIVKTAEKYVPEMKKDGADIIVALAHTGMGSVEPQEMAENAGYQLTKIEGIDVVVSGHSHVAFPAKSYEGMKGIDIEKGLVNGKAYNIAGSLADALGIVDITLENEEGKWKVSDAKSYNEPVYDKKEKKALAQNDEEMVKIFEKDHLGTLEYVRSSIGETKSPIYSFLALAQDDSSIQLVNSAQKWYVAEKMKGTDKEKLPVLSAAAPFKAGGRMGPDYYTNIPKGTLAIKNMADLYVYPNTLHVLELTGAEVKEWLEMSAGQFNQIDPTKKEEQMLVNDKFPTYNFDVIDGVTYEIDITKPAKYDDKGKLINEKAERISNLQFNGKAIVNDAKFLVATNNYRAGGGGNFPGISLKKSVFAAPDENRQIIVDYIKSMKTVDPKADGNWKFKKIDNKDVKVILLSSPKAKEFIGNHYKYAGEGKDGYVKYELLSIY